MRTDAVWNTGGYWEAPSFITGKPENIAITIDITKCIIKVSQFGYSYLYFNDKKVKKLTFLEYLKYRGYVKDVIREDDN